MDDDRGWMRGSTLKKGICLAVVALGAVLLAWAVVAAQSESDFVGRKTGPPFAEDGEEFTYTIEVTNTTGATSASATLTDELPSGVAFKECSYAIVGLTLAVPCGPPPELWTLSVPPGALVRTTLVVEADTGTAVWPVVNTAELSWDSYTLEMGPVTTTLNPAQTYLPFVARNFAP